MPENKTPAKETPARKTRPRKMAVTKVVKLDVDSDLVRRLADLIAETGLSEIEVGDGDHRLRVARGGVHNAVQDEAPAPAQAPSPPPADSPPPAAADAAAGGAPPPGAVPSPMVGTIYTAPEPGEAPFVSVGDTVAKDDILFIIEAMKVMNPIRSPRAGTVMEIMVENGDPVEFGETLLVLG